MNRIWVYGDTRTERFFGYSLNVLGKARDLARAMQGQAGIVLLGAGSGLDQAAELCIRSGADFVLAGDDPGLETPIAQIHARVLAQAAQALNPRLVLFPLTEFGRDVAARAARIKGAGLIADCVDIALEDGRAVASCPSWGGRIMARIAFADPGATGFATVQPHGFRPPEGPGAPGAVERLSLGPVGPPKGLKLVSRCPEPEAAGSLEQADVVVVGGAGVGSAEGFSRLRELAAALGGQIAATRPPVLSHWVDENRLIGQTGKTVRPRLLLSVGASGAVQFTAGIMESGRIVAINRDKNAPVFEVADTGIVADAGAFVPLLTQKARQALLRRVADGVVGARKEEARSGLGPAVKKLREAREWSLETLAQATGQSPEFIEQVESGTQAPSVAFLLRLARALSVDPGTFLGEEEKTAIRDSRAKDFIKRTKNYSYECLTPEAESEHLRAFMVTIESKQAHKPVAYKHEGEEFIFVMDGDLELTLDGTPQVLKQGESLRFNSEIPHKLKSLSDESTRCLVVLYTP